MSAVASVHLLARGSQRGERVSWPRLLWVAPLTVAASVLACDAMRSLVIVIDPALSAMGQLGAPMVTLVIEGALAAIVVFTLFTLFVPRAIYWFRIAGIIALLLSLAPDIALGLGGTPMRLAMRYVAPLTMLGNFADQGGAQAGPPPGAGAQGGPPPGFTSGLPLPEVIVLMLLHAGVAAVCIGLLTTLSRHPVRRSSPSA